MNRSAAFRSNARKRFICSIGLGLHNPVLTPSRIAFAGDLIVHVASLSRDRSSRLIWRRFLRLPQPNPTEAQLVPDRRAKLARSNAIEGRDVQHPNPNCRLAVTRFNSNLLRFSPRKGCRGRKILGATIGSIIITRLASKEFCVRLKHRLRSLPRLGFPKRFE